MPASSGITQINVEALHTLGSQTRQTSNMWDEIWNRTMQAIITTAGDGLDDATAQVLLQRNAEYNARTAEFREGVDKQAMTNDRMGDHSAGVNRQMVGRLGGSTV